MPLPTTLHTQALLPKDIEFSARSRVLVLQKPAYDMKKRKGIRYAQDIGPHTVILMPQNLDQQHWVLLKFDMQAGVGEVYDPMPKVHRAIMRTAYTMLWLTKVRIRWLH